MRRLFALAFLMLLGAAPPVGAPPHRIVSLNLCADQLLVALADPGQIAALTDLSRDPAMSAVARRAATLPVARGAAEAVLALRPDLLLASPGTSSATMAHLRGRYVEVDLPPADRYADIVGQVRTVAAAVGHPDRGEALIRRMDARLARIARTGRGRIAASYQRRGYLTGTGTLTDELMMRVGLVNLAARLGKPMLARVPLEQMALARPDFLLIESDSEGVVDQGTEMLHHPVLRSTPRLRLPQAWTVCGGPAYVLAAESLSRQLARQR
ncbi:iron complex transport system substrate-binding protein [Sphingomonas aerophila]|uniref:Iron complex transport system substrate-binding protein n=2 Tax=Sphingomonas aerophila TaxID=1344948 RepID=A0A7W9BCK6_9SPHN|nr:iron complex transport system substrate-binding protein [Sphingomonas aerophila]